MAVRAQLIDPSNETAVSIKNGGRLITGAFDFSVPVAREMSSTGTAYNFAVAKPNLCFIITDIIIAADRNVSNSVPATVDIFEASNLLDTTPDTDILKLELLRNERFALSGLNFQVTASKYLNATTDDATILMTIAGYFVPTV